MDLGADGVQTFRLVERHPSMQATEKRGTAELGLFGARGRISNRRPSDYESVPMGTKLLGAHVRDPCP